MEPYEHRDKIALDFAALVRKKYDQGQKEHGGELWRKPVLFFMVEEVVDMAVYMMTILEQVDQIREHCELGMKHTEEEHSHRLFESIKSILEVGNPEGEKLDD